MDEQTALVLALQLVALFSIAGALLLYLLCKIRGGPEVAASDSIPGAGKPVLITTCDNALGLQIAIHLANKGFRVFAGLRKGAAAGSEEDTLSSRVLRSWQKQRESSGDLCQGSIIAFPFDVTREDLLHESLDIIRAHLPAGEDGIWAILNTSGIAYRGRLDQQDVTHWETMMKTNVVGLLRVARTFQGLLKNVQGRIIAIGSTEDCSSGLVAYNASKFAVEGACAALAQEWAPSGIKVVTLNPKGLTPDLLYAVPKLKDENSDVSVDITGCIEYMPAVLSQEALQNIEIALTSGIPKFSYSLAPTSLWSRNNIPCLRVI